jgi:hypothetical protein
MGDKYFDVTTLQPRLVVGECFTRLMEATQRYEALRRDYRALEANETIPRDKRAATLEPIAAKRKSARDELTVAMLLYQEAARARDSEAATTLANANVDISKSMKRWTVLIVAATAVQAVFAALQYFASKGCH